jgi:hypothetical protein
MNTQSKPTFRDRPIAFVLPLAGATVVISALAFAGEWRVIYVSVGVAALWWCVSIYDAMRWHRLRTDDRLERIERKLGLRPPER